jgi:ferredoxin--NADP+ reductase
MALKVAVVGSGPSGFYTTEALAKRIPGCEIDVIERLPTPFGLIRGGVAPDHQSTKRVARAFERIAQRPEVRFFGNVTIGKDISIAELQAAYDAVVLAIGAPLDRHLDIPGGNLPGVIGSAAFVGWYNGHPDFRELQPNLNCAGVAIIGNGNVALDIARLLVKTRAELARTDLPDYALEAIAGAPITDVHMLGRRGPVEAKFTNVELREMGQLENCVPVVDAKILPESLDGLDMSERDLRLKQKNLATLQSFRSVDPKGKSKRVHFSFFAKPLEVLGEKTVSGLRMERTRVVDGAAVGTGETFVVDCGLVIPAIGYRSSPVKGLPFDEVKGIIPSQNARVADGLYVAGWIARGPTGVIGTNKPDGALVAEQIQAQVEDGGKPGRQALAKTLTGRDVHWVDYEGWQAIDRAEIAAARDGAPRAKFVTVDAMLAIADDISEAAQ